MQVTQLIPLDGNCLDRPCNLTGLGKLVDGGADTQAVTVKQCPTSLFQRVGCGFTVFEGLKTALIPFVNTRNAILHGLRAKRRPPGVFGNLLAPGNRCFHMQRGKRCFVHSLVTAMQRNTNDCG
jgi:hypothetical protein